jgi:hypothetical protein
MCVGHRKKFLDLINFLTRKIYMTYASSYKSTARLNAFALTGQVLNLICVGGMLFQSGTAAAFETSGEIEKAACVASTADLGIDSSRCVDMATSCQAPSWFPVLGDGDSASYYETYSIDPNQRWNKTEYAKGEYTHWDHIWYSAVEVPYGPALPEVGHQWHEFAGSALVKRATCDVHSTWSWP